MPILQRAKSKLQASQREGGREGHGGNRVPMSDPHTTVKHTVAIAAGEDVEVEVEEEVRDFAARFARLVVNRAFRGDDVLGATKALSGAATPRRSPGGAATAAAGTSVADNSNSTSKIGGGGISSGHSDGDRSGDGIGGSSGGGGRISSGSSRGIVGGRNPTALGAYTAEAELSLRGSQRLGAQLEKDAGMLRSRVFPALLENARQLHALYVAIDRLAEEVMPEVDATIKRMERAVYDLEELRKEQVDTGAPHGSFGLGVALGAGLWFPQTRVAVVPEIFDTDKVFRVQEGGLAPL